MRATIKFDDKHKEFIARTAVFADELMGLMASSIHSQIITSGRVPMLPKSTKNAQRGALRASIRHNKLSVGQYEVTAGKNSPAQAYAASQEAGTTRGYPIRNYSTPGTGAHWFRDAVNTIKERKLEYINKALTVAGLRSIE